MEFPQTGQSAVLRKKMLRRRYRGLSSLRGLISEPTESERKHGKNKTRDTDLRSENK